MISNKPVILLVDDTLTNLAFLNTILQQQGYRVLLARSGEKALTIAKREKPDLILLDVVMPGWDGYETCRRIKSDDSLVLIPVLFLSELKSAEDKLRAFAAGGVDYVHKSFQEEELLARVQTHVELYRLREKLEQKVAEREQQILAHAIELEKKVEERTAEVNQAKEMAEAANLSKSQFLAKMSHELRTPLNAILGYTEMLMEDAQDLKLTDFVKDFTRILGSGKHLLGLINDVLDLSKVESGTIELYLETFPVEKLLNEVIAIIQPLVEKKTNLLEVKIMNALGEITADLTRTRQILFNLLSNAAKFTENGKIALEAEREHDLAKEYICFRISDNGIGMTPAQQSKLFQAFTQVNSSISRRFGGTGLGLVITKQFLERMGGEIQVESEFGQGTTFIVRLPTQVQLEEAMKESTTEKPVIQEPVTEKPVTEVPEKMIRLPTQVQFEEVTEESTTEKPVTEESVTEKPVIEASEKIVSLSTQVQFEEATEESVTEKPVTQESTTEKSVTQEAVTQKPVTKKLVKIVRSSTQAQLEKATEKSTTEKPVTEEPIIEKPVTKKLVKIIRSPSQAQLEKATEESTTQKPAIEEPVTEEPVTEEPVIETPAENEPAPDETEAAIIDNETLSISNNDKIIRELSFEIYFSIGGDLSEF